MDNIKFRRYLQLCEIDKNGLSVNSIKLTKENIKTLCSYILISKSMTKLDLSNTGINGEDLSRIFAALKKRIHKSVEEINISHNEFSGEDFMLISQFIKAPTHPIKKYNFSHCKFNDDDVHLLLCLLPSDNEFLNYIDLSYNKITEEFVKVFLKNTRIETKYPITISIANDTVQKLALPKNDDSNVKILTSIPNFDPAYASKSLGTIAALAKRTSSESNNTSSKSTNCFLRFPNSTKKPFVAVLRDGTVFTSSSSTGLGAISLGRISPVIGGTLSTSISPLGDTLEEGEVSPLLFNRRSTIVPSNDTVIGTIDAAADIQRGSGNEASISYRRGEEVITQPEPVIHEISNDDDANEITETPSRSWWRCCFGR